MLQSETPPLMWKSKPPRWKHRTLPISWSPPPTTVKKMVRASGEEFLSRHSAAIDCKEAKCLVGDFLARAEKTRLAQQRPRKKRVHRKGYFRQLHHGFTSGAGNTTKQNNGRDREASNSQMNKYGAVNMQALEVTNSSMGVMIVARRTASASIENSRGRNGEAALDAAKPPAASPRQG